MPDPTDTAAVRCIHCGKEGTHRVCDECFKTQGSAAVRCIHCGKEGTHRVCDECFKTQGSAATVVTRDVLDLLRSLRRAGHCSGIVLSHGTRKRYGDVIRMIEKREARSV